jgi:hypothetical protein
VTLAGGTFNLPKLIEANRGTTLCGCTAAN